jgi:hypothetical protein
MMVLAWSRDYVVFVSNLIFLLILPGLLALFMAIADLFQGEDEPQSPPTIRPRRRTVAAADSFGASSDELTIVITSDDL